MTGEFFKKLRTGLYKGALNPPEKALRRLFNDHGVGILVGHPTFRNADNIGSQIGKTIKGAAVHFPEKVTAVVVADGTLTAESGDYSTIEKAIEGAGAALDETGASGRVIVVVTPYEGYAGDFTPGKGSALKMIFEEGVDTSIDMFVLLDGDLRNDMAQWLGVFKKVDQMHRKALPESNYFITARYARHFVDASLTRFVVGPLTTLLGRYVPGGISGDIVLSGGAVRHELGPWSEARRKYGTDISTTFDNIAHENTVVYEVYLGAKLHDITDEGKLSVMPGEVIGAALESLLRHRTVLEKVLKGDAELEEPVRLGPDFTGIEFIDPGRTGVFNVFTKMKTLTDKWPEFSDEVKMIAGGVLHGKLEAAVADLKVLAEKGKGPLRFVGLGNDEWIDCLYRAVGSVLAGGDLNTAKRALNYLYTAAFLEFCRLCLADLGLETVEDVEAAQSDLGVEAEKAREFYARNVEGRAEELAHAFFSGRRKILEYSGI